MFCHLQFPVKICNHPNKFSKISLILIFMIILKKTHHVDVFSMQFHVDYNIQCALEIYSFFTVWTVFVLLK